MQASKARERLFDPRIWLKNELTSVCIYAKKFQRADFMLHLYGRNIAWIEVKAIFTLYGNEASVIIVFDID